MISAKIILDSVNDLDKRLTTIEFVAPRSILAQFNTHRVFSRNAASSRAIPVSKIITKVEETPFIPIWNVNKKGMSGVDSFSDKEKVVLTHHWLNARDDAIKHAKTLSELGAHKQIVNRILEPFSYFQGVVSSTEWTNFLELREHDAAQPEIATLATAIHRAIDDSSPVHISKGWHLPYVLPEELELDIQTQLKISVARCARVSYKTFDDAKVSTVDKDIALYFQLLESKHGSCFEHQATPMSIIDDLNTKLQGNFQGWLQNRKLLGF